MQFFAAGRQRRLHGPFDQNAISGKNSLNIIHAQVPARAASIWTLAKWTTAESAQRGPAACCGELGAPLGSQNFSCTQTGTYAGSGRVNPSMQAFVTPDCEVS